MLGSLDLLISFKKQACCFQQFPVFMLSIANRLLNHLYEQHHIYLTVLRVASIFLTYSYQESKPIHFTKFMIYAHISI